MAIATTNPIVENALKACNWGSLKIGTRVEVDGRKGAVVANPGNSTRYTVKFDDGKIEDANSLAPYFKVVNAETAEKQVVKNGRFGSDPYAKKTMYSMQDARSSVQKARMYIGQAEIDEAPGIAMDIDKCIKEIDAIIGWIKDYV